MQSMKKLDDFKVKRGLTKWFSGLLRRVFFKIHREYKDFRNTKFTRKCSATEAENIITLK